MFSVHPNTYNSAINQSIQGHAVEIIEMWCDFVMKWRLEHLDAKNCFKKKILF